METAVYNQQGEAVGKVSLPPKIFGVKFNSDLVHQVLRVQLANSRHVLAHAKDRSEVRGGGKKPWRQKGTGRSRHGSTRSPLWKGGGVTFGPTKNRNYALKINKKMKQRALFMVLSRKNADKELTLVDALKIDEPKTRVVAAIFRDLKGKIGKDFKKGTLVVMAKKDEGLRRAARNLPFLKTIFADSLNILDLMSFKHLLMSKEAIEVIEKTYYKGL